MAELSPEIIAALKRDLARCDEDRRTIAAATGRDEADSEWCAVIRLDRFRLALAALERIPELERENDELKASLLHEQEVCDTERQRAERVEAALEGLRGHRQHVSRNILEPGICVQCRRTWPCDVGLARAALADAPASVEVAPAEESDGGR